jgi:hypothetical protein
LPQDFHQAVDKKISDRALWTQIQNDTKTKAEQNAGFIHSLYAKINQTQDNILPQTNPTL